MFTNFYILQNKEVMKNKNFKGIVLVLYISNITYFIYNSNLKYISYLIVIFCYIKTYNIM